jgi:hypothetical protein
MKRHKEEEDIDISKRMSNDIETGKQDDDSVYHGAAVSVLPP